MMMSLRRMVGLAPFAMAMSCSLVAAAGSTASAAERPVVLVAVGDLPTAGAFDRFEGLIAAINAIAPDVTVHVGDIKGASTPCTDAAFARVAEYLNGIAGPVLYTPGDNEWTDCHHEPAGSYHPLERLATLRELFFASDRSLGTAPVRLVVQPDEQPRHGAFVENRRWVHRGVVFVTIHAVGSNDGDNPDIPGAVAEHIARSAAARDWLTRGFEVARERMAGALVVAMQGKPHATMMQLARYRGLLETLAEGARSWDGPVLVVHGDGHVYTVDRPFADAANRRLDNVVRLEVPGAADVRAVRVTIDPGAEDVFAFEPFGPAVR